MYIKCHWQQCLLVFTLPDGQSHMFAGNILAAQLQTQVIADTCNKCRPMLCLDSYSCRFANSWHCINRHSVGCKIFCVCHHKRCALILRYCQSFPQPMADMSIVSSLAYQRINSALFCPTLCSCNLWKVCGTALLTCMRV